MHPHPLQIMASVAVGSRSRRRGDHEIASDGAVGGVGTTGRGHGPAHPQIVIPRACGGSSTLQLIGSIAGVSGILDRPPSRAMTAEGHTFAFPRRHAPEVCENFHAPRNQRARGMPDARCTRGLVCKRAQEHAHEHTGQRRASDIPCAMVLRLITRSPRRIGLCCLRRLANMAARARLG
jgi:hypothetical protein